jgi:hypothetical protein
MPVGALAMPDNLTVCRMDHPIVPERFTADAIEHRPRTTNRDGLCGGHTVPNDGCLRKATLGFETNTIDKGPALL